MTSIGDWTFTGCTSLICINIPYSVTNIGAGAFNGCTSLSKINIPNSVISIGIGVFATYKVNDYHFMLLGAYDRLPICM